jgi:membrane dipeptidase
MTRRRDYKRAGRQFTSEGQARSGLTAVFDSMMDGTGCIVSHTGWSWEETVYDIGMRRADLAHQTYAHVVYGIDDIYRAHRDGTIGLVLSLEAATPIEIRSTGSTSFTASASGRWASPPRRRTPSAGD